jgi:hypothetical protein
LQKEKRVLLRGAIEVEERRGEADVKRLSET